MHTMSVYEGAFPGIICPSVAPESSYRITSLHNMLEAKPSSYQARTTTAAVVVATTLLLTGAVAVLSGWAPAGQAAVGATAPAESQALG